MISLPARHFIHVRQPKAEGYKVLPRSGACFRNPRPSQIVHIQHLSGRNKNSVQDAVYLLSEASAYMTGGEMLITDGLHAGRGEWSCHAPRKFTPEDM